MNETKRNSALDLVRIFATFCVISFHYTASMGFMDVYIAGGRMYLMCILRSLTSVCVPLFLLLTGYLMRNKRWSGSYYLGIVKTLSIYAMASALCYYLEFRCLDLDFLVALINGTGTGYSWYIQMYTGLFLMIPFLNMMYRGDQAGVDVRKYKKVLIGTLLVLTALPGVLNIYVFSGDWWRHPSISRDYVHLMSTFWAGIYPIAFYMIGSYLAEYGLNMRRRTCAFWLVLVVLAKGTFDFYRADGMEYASGAWQEYGSLFQVVQAVLVFQFISSIQTRNFAPWVKKGLKTASDLCFGAYMVSEVFEQLFYPALKANVTSAGLRMNYYPLMAGMVFVCSMALSGVLNLLYDALRKLLTISKKKA